MPVAVCYQMALGSARLLVLQAAERLGTSETVVEELKEAIHRRHQASESKV